MISVRSSLKYLVHWSLNIIVWIQGLVTKERKNLDPAAAPFAKGAGETMGLGEGANLLEVVKHTKFY